MRYVLSWTNRLTSASKENEEGAKRAVELFSKWEPP